ncbi:MAG: hypothetical protein BGO40_03845 [Chryseobacterium sp. 39-10]|nr:hypothetical protein [Chryseobacterium sp.]OJV48852.1 MAG: hypothetical protein BGO40_03845 [Chryseobacterium sp. 39-10]
MNFKYRFFLLVLLFLGVSAKSQFTMHKLVSVGYVYQNQSFGEIGGKLLFLNNDDVLYRIGASAVMGSVNSQLGIMPKIQGDVLLNFEKGVDLYHSYYFLAGAEATTKYIAPKVGFSLFGLMDLAAGYAFSLGGNGLNGKEMNGFNLNFTLNMPIPMLQDYLK